MKKILILSLCFLIVVGLSGCVSQVGEIGGEKTIKIVTSAPMRSINHGQDISRGVKLALEEVNYQVSNFKIEIVTEDDGDENGQWQESLEEEIAKRAVADQDVMAYIATLNSGAAKISIPITNEGGLVQISPANTWPGLTKAGFFPGEPGIFYPTGMRNFFRVCTTDDNQGPAAAIWAKDLGFKNIFIYDDGEAYGKGIADLFAEKATVIGLNVVGQKTIDRTAEDLTDELNEIKDLDIDLIYFGGMSSHGAIPIIKGIEELEMTAKFMAPDGVMDPAFIEGGVDATEGAYLTTVAVPPEEVGGKANDFYNNYVEMYDMEPGSFSGLGYEAAKVVLLAIEKAGTNDRGMILEEVSKIKDYDGLFGTWSFDQNGDTTLTLMSGNIVKDKVFVFEKLLSAK
ncbi:MAG: branched-chain amino acid ABC transporter substrate-binding protein [Candidatus Peribacteraceae bacterium]|nr:branched-chain amino acid ABC transporter substrate-binding protein [Candidatus Peribacteraceae bacterium]